MMRYITTQTITIPAGSEFIADDSHGKGGVVYVDDHGLMRVFLGRAAALRDGMIVARPNLTIVADGGV